VRLARRTLLSGSAAALAAGSSLARAQPPASPEPWTIPAPPTGSPADELRIHTDWAQLQQYREDDLRVRQLPAAERHVVFLGDSITRGWQVFHPEFFTANGFVDRGISGQTTPQMLARMFEDVIGLKPAAVLIFAGTNDIARNTGIETAAMVEENFQAMTELAQAHGIKAILCAITPVADYGPRRMTDGRPPADIQKLNAWLKQYASQAHAIYADYYAAVVDDKGLLREGLSRDGLHPNDKGYELLAPVAAAAIQQALSK
jgi:lysophospholipase L1-like esterase